jgi:hypothetical protein
MKGAFSRGVIVSSTLALALAFAGCDSDDGDKDDEADVAEPAADTGGGDAAEPSADAAQPDAAPAPEAEPAPAPEAGGDLTYEGDAGPIFAAKCTPCHTGGSSGGHDIGSSHAESQKAAGACPDKTIAECAVVRIENGTMPLGKGCGGPVADDAANAGTCVTETELQTLKDWIAGGAGE